MILNIDRLLAQFTLVVSYVIHGENGQVKFQTQHHMGVKIIILCIAGAGGGIEVRATNTPQNPGSPWHAGLW